MINKYFTTTKFSFCPFIIIIISVFMQISCRETRQDASREDSVDDMRTLMFYTGSYAGEEEPGICLFEYDLTTGEFNKIQELSGHINPSFLAVDAEAGFLYAVNETAGFDDENSGSVTSFSIDKTTGKLSFVNRQSSRGAHPCHISLIADGRFVAVANYSGGSVAVFPVLADGYLQPATGFVQHQGSGPHERRQRAPHAHSIYPVNKGPWVIAADLGIDKVLIYKIDGEGNLTPGSATPSAAMEPGAGPRHLAFHPGGKWIYVLNELNSTVTRLLFDNDSGAADVMESTSTLPEGYEGENFCADIHVHPGGRFLYASNRGHNSIAVFELTHEGVPVLIGHEPVRGEWPRNFNIDPSGSLLFVANQNTGNIAVFKIDNETGLLDFTGSELEVSRPVCIRFLSR